MKKRFLFKCIAILTAISFVFQGCATTTVIDKKNERGKLLATEVVNRKAKPETKTILEPVNSNTVKIYQKTVDYTEQRKTFENIEKITEQRCTNKCDPREDATLLGTTVFFGVLTFGFVVPPILLLCALAERNICKNELLTSTAEEPIRDIEYTVNEEAAVQTINSGFVKVTANDVNLQDIPIRADGTAVLDMASVFGNPKFSKLMEDIHVIYEYENAKAETTIARSEAQKIFASRVPPDLRIDAKDIRYEQGLKGGKLTGDDSGEIKVTVTNSDKEGTAWGVNLAVSGNSCPDVNYDKLLPIGNLQPGQNKTVNIPVTAGLNATDCKLNLTVQAREEFGQDSRKVKIPPIVISALDRPDIAVASMTPSGTAQNGRGIDLMATVANNGIGNAKGVVVKLGDLPEGITPSWTSMEIGDMPPHSNQKLPPLTLQFDKLYGKEKKNVEISMTVSDKRPIGKPSSKRLNLEYHFASPLIKVADVEYFDGNDPGGLSKGNSNGKIEQDERILARVHVENAGDMLAENVLVSMASDSSRLAISPSAPVKISLRPNEKKPVDFKFRVPNSLDPGPVKFTVHASENTFSTRLAEVSTRTIYEAGTIEGTVASAAAPPPGRAPRVTGFAGDENIDEVPFVGYKREDAYALVIGIGRYNVQGVKRLPFAKNDAQTIREYLANISGVPRDNIHVLTDEQATFIRIIKELGWIRKNATDKSQVFIYYSGHGVADGAHKPYLLPHDGEPSSIEEMGFSIDQLKKEISRFKTKRVLVALDACYTGEGRSGSIKGQRGVAWADDDATPTEAVIINSSTLRESSWDYDQKQHGLFTYFLLKGMRGEAPDLNGDGFVDASELYDYIKKEVPRASAKYCPAQQSPIIQGNGNGKGMIVSKRLQ